jgi:hypothetical protein
MRYASMNLSFTACYAHLISPVDIIVDPDDYHELLLVDIYNLHCAVVIDRV